MPLYEYHCQLCGNDFDKLLLVELRDSVSCTKCGAKVDRVMSNFQYKMFDFSTKDGEGFKTIQYSKDEYNARWRDKNYDYRDRT